MEIWRLLHQLSPDNRRHQKWIKRHVYAQNQTITLGRLLKFFWQRALNQSGDIIQLLQRHTSLAGHRKLNMTQSLLQSDLDSEQIRWSGLTPDLVPHLLKGPLTTSTKYKVGCRRNWSKCQLEWFAFILLPFCTIIHQLRALQPPWHFCTVVIYISPKPLVTFLWHNSKGNKKKHQLGSQFNI